jgi:methylmalonyl-CoA mutase
MHKSGMDELTLAAEFPAATREDWMKLVARVLKSGDFEKALVGRTYDGIRIEPIYEKAEEVQAPLLAPYGRWRIAQRVDHPDPDAANTLALADLEGGADALTLVIPEAPSARGFGLGARSVDDLDRALRDVKLDLVQLRVEAGREGFAAAALVAALAERRGHALPDLDLDLGIDPIGAMAVSSDPPAPWPTVAEGCAKTLSLLRKHGSKGCAFLADGRPYHEAGGSEAQELAAVLATGVAYLRTLEAGGHDLDAARHAVSFLLVADADQLLTVAKLRALRRLWARIEAACGLEPRPIRLHSETAWRMATRRDPWVNLLRSTLAAFSAGLGGADSIAVLPFTAALGLPDAFARRLARNTQLILLEEANLGRVADPAAGAGGFEALTDALCETAWGLFQEIEREGGIVASLQAGALQARVAAVRSARERAVTTRRQPITGTSEFPDLQETPVTVLLSAAAIPPREGREDSDTSASEPRVGRQRDVARSLSGNRTGPHPGRYRDSRSPSGREIEALPSIRDAEPYERLREASDAQLARTGARPTVFLANLGTPADFTERASFAEAFFAAGGIEATPGDGLVSPETAAAAFAASGARIACLCSSDRLYESQAGPLASALRKAGARAVYVAADPARLQERLPGAGVSYIFAGCDALAVLSEASEAAAA